MGALHTKKSKIKKVAKQMATIQVMDDLLHIYVDIWANQEIDNLIKTGTLVFIPIEQGYQLGKHQLLKTDDERWQVIDPNGECRAVMYNCQSAVFYTIFEQKQQFSKSQEILLQDRIVGILLNDQRLLRHKYKQACASGDSFKRDLCIARLSDVNPKLTHASEQLKKLINLAKYNKVWERNHETTRTRKQGVSQAN